jgi:opacity protein-like surface antigen
MKQTATVFILLFTANLSIAQQENKIIQTKPKRFEYYFNGAFGFYFPFNTTKTVASRGNVNTFQIQVNYKDYFFSRLCFDQYNVGYEDNVTINSLSTYIKDKVQTTYIGLDIGYTFHLGKMLSPFAYIGAGYTTMDVPTVSYDNIQNNLRIVTSTKSFLGLRGGIGAEYEFNKFFILYADAQYLSIPFKTDLSNKDLNGISLQIGFKTPLQ